MELHTLLLGSGTSYFWQSPGQCDRCADFGDLSLQVSANTRLQPTRQDAEAITHVDNCSWCTTPCTARRGKRPRKRLSPRTASCCCTTCTRSCRWCTPRTSCAGRRACGTAWRCGSLRARGRESAFFQKDRGHETRDRKTEDKKPRLLFGWKNSSVSQTQNASFVVRCC